MKLNLNNMKSLVDYIKEDGEAVGIAPSIGSMEDAGRVDFASPGNTLGMGNPKPPTYKEPGTDLFGMTSKMVQTEKKKKKKKKEND